MATSYWIAHPTAPGFISAFSPEGVGQFLMIARDWPPGRYVIRQYRGGCRESKEGDACWGHATKDGNGNVWIDARAQSNPAECRTSKFVNRRGSPCRSCSTAGSARRLP
jgi:hypothetical protein